MRWWWWLVVSGCSTSSNVGHDAAAVSCVVDPPPVPCGVEQVTGTVPGISISIHSDACVYRQGCAAAFAFDITIADPAPSLTYAAEPPGSCTSRPRPYTNDPQSLVRAMVTGGNQYWCRDCDGECAPGEDALTLQLAPGTSSSVVEWSGHAGSPNYDDDPFDPGEYTVGIVFDGGTAGYTRAELAIQIVP